MQIYVKDLLELHQVYIYCRGHRWLWSYGSWIYNHLCNQCLSPLMWVWISIRARCTTLCDKVCQWLFSIFPVSSTNKTDCQDITEILLKVALNIIKQTNKNKLKTGDCEKWMTLRYNCSRKMKFPSLRLTLEYIFKHLK